MPAYLLLILAILSRVFLASFPHPDWFNFTAMGGALLYFGARRNWREFLPILPILMVTDYLLTTSVYAYPFRWQAYVTTWAWYLMAMALGQILLHSRTTFVRVAAGVVLGPTSFFVVSNFGVWAGGTMAPQYPPTLTGLATCFVAGLPFYRNDMLSTGIVAGLVFGVPVLVRRMKKTELQPALIRK